MLTYYQDVTFRQRIEKQLSTIELSNKFGRAIFFANGQVFQQGELESMQMATACQTLIQNAITLWNYLYLSDYLLRADEEERTQTIQRMKRSSMLSWGHVNCATRSRATNCFRKLRITCRKPTVPPVVFYLSMRFWQRNGVKPQEQRNLGDLYPIGRFVRNDRICQH